MSKRKHRFQLGWFGWTFISVILLTVVGSSVIFFNVFNLDFGQIFGEDRSPMANEQTKVEEPATKDTIEHVEKVQETVGSEHQEAGEFIADMHVFYNNTTGYGGIRSLNWDEQKEQAKNISETITDLLPEVKSEELITDLQHIQNLANKVLEEEKTDHVRNLHRMFHDLDIALNSYNGYDKIWNVTETLKRMD